MNPRSLLLCASILIFQEFVFCQNLPATKTQTQTKPSNKNAVSAPQTEAKPKPKDRNPDSFVCPDPEAKKACASYEELKRANDPTLKEFLSSSGRAFICFRKNVDEFFLIRFDWPTYLSQRHFDRDLKKMVINDDATQTGYVHTVTFDNGIDNSVRVPGFTFKGTWTYFDESLGASFFQGRNIFEKSDEDTSASPLSITNYQLEIDDYKYQNGENKTVHYNLTIQNSTGRYSESFRIEDEKIPFIDRPGRCLMIGK
jgi:hypothetical protein